MKKLIALLLACMLLVATFAACAGSGESSAEPSDSSQSSESSTENSESTPESQEPSDAPEEMVTFTYVVPGDAPIDYDRGIADVNAKLAADGTGIQIDVTYYPWDVWDQRINVMLSTGEKFDAFHVMNDRVTLSNYASRGALADIGPAMDQYGQNIVANVPALAIKDGKVNGTQYGIPAFWVESALDEQATIRKDILDEMNLPMPTTLDELTDVYKQVMANWTGDTPPYFPSPATNDRWLYFMSEENDFVIYDYLVYVNQDGTVADIYETDVYKEIATRAKDWYDSGLIHPDVLTYTNDNQTAQFQSGDWFVLNGTVGSINDMGGIDDVTDIAWLDLLNGDHEIRPYGVKNLQAVPLASEHPEAAVKFFNWLYSSQENFDLMVYGTEGVDYTKGENRSYEAIVDPDAGAVKYSFSTWMVGNINYGYLNSTCPPDINDHLYKTDTEAEDSIAAGFVFDATPVQTQFADVQTVISSTLLPISWGVQDYDSNIDNAIAMLKTAGVDAVIEEWKTQFAAFQASQG